MATTATTARTFTIFVDEAPVRLRTKKGSNNTATILTQDKSAGSSNTNVPAPAPSFATSSEKENLHPITSVRLGLDGALKQKGKDGKGKSALTTKLFLPKAERIEKDKPEMKKRRLASASTSSTSSNILISKSTKSTITDLRSKSKIPRKKDSRAGLTKKVAELPKVEEESEVKDVKAVKAVKDAKVVKAAEKVKAKAMLDEQETMKALSAQAQAVIDAKCYDLTVSPLADVSEAYEQMIASDVPLRKKPTPQIRVTSENDLLAKTPSQSVRSRGSARVPSPPPAALPSVAAISEALRKDKGPSKDFSTPERKEIYAAFTFSSPSPSAKRFAASRGTGGAFAFGDIAFNPAW